MNLACSERTVRQEAISHVTREQVVVVVELRNKGNAVFQLFERQETHRQPKTKSSYTAQRSAGRTKTSNVLYNIER